MWGPAGIHLSVSNHLKKKLFPLTRAHLPAFAGISKMPIILSCISLQDAEFRRCILYAGATTIL